MEKSLNTAEGIVAPVMPEEPGQPIKESSEPLLTVDNSTEQNHLAATLRYNALPIAGNHRVREPLPPILKDGEKSAMHEITSLLFKDLSFKHQFSLHEAYRVDNLTLEYQYANNMIAQHSTLSVAYIQDPARNVTAPDADRIEYRPSTYQFNRVGDYMRVNIPCVSNWLYTDTTISRYSSPGRLYFLFPGEGNVKQLPNITLISDVSFKCPTVRSSATTVEEFLQFDKATLTFDEIKVEDESMPFPATAVFSASTKYDSLAATDAVAFLVSPGILIVNATYDDGDSYTYEVTLSRCRLKGAGTSTLFMFDVSDLMKGGETTASLVSSSIDTSFRVFYTVEDVMQ
ncbi:hypothetical protein [Wenzhou shrimp virus 3]|uniref:hypothetical protein n=1 Tax=Wenzhou shrimp virus 3 TaxID=1923650 RepID=UPI00090A4931|nr:hypothetical protein [Wenzhou shrimp virus 3]APG77705.1 hypothetical protein [Wenzhou shrimp virus 3]